MPSRTSIIQTIGAAFLRANVENEEWSYAKAFVEEHKPFSAWHHRRGSGRKYQTVDLRFVDNDVTVLVETKVDFQKDYRDSEAQLQAYVTYEKALTGNKIVAILANTGDSQIRVWRGPVSDDTQVTSMIVLQTFAEYADLYSHDVNDKEAVMANTYRLNETLHRHGIAERLRSQFVGTCVLALKNGAIYKDLTTAQIIAGIRDVLGKLLDKDLNKASKLTLLDSDVLSNQDIRDLPPAAFREILSEIEVKILPFINDRSTAGQDLLNLFFIQFNKYVGKADKNQAFTPDHVTDFMGKAISINRNSRVLDPCCGSGSFLVRAMTQAMDDASSKSEQDGIKRSQIYGIEYDEHAYGLATTNMLIHSDGNSNIIQGSCFDQADWIRNAHINAVLMNPPYNAQRKHMPREYTDTWAKDGKEDPSKGLYFAHYIASLIPSGMLAVLLPVQCAIGSSKEILKYKSLMLQEHTLDAVFTMPPDVFHPGASAVTCCMIFRLGVRHYAKGNLPTYFGYYRDDGFMKKKNLGRVEKANAAGKSVWETTEELWLQLYRERRQVPGLSAVATVTANDEWLAEAYMETDYSSLSQDAFEKTVRRYAAFLLEENA